MFRLIGAVQKDPIFHVKRSMGKKPALVLCRIRLCNFALERAILNSRLSASLASQLPQHRVELVEIPVLDV